MLSNCCSAPVYAPSDEWTQCLACKEYCDIVKEEEPTRQQISQVMRELRKRQEQTMTSDQKRSRAQKAAKARWQKTKKSATLQE